MAAIGNEIPDALNGHGSAARFGNRKKVTASGHGGYSVLVIDFY